MTAATVPSIDVVELARRLSSDDDASRPRMLDVREDWERQIAAIAGSIDMPMNAIPDNLDQLREAQGDRDLVVLCHSGRRSQMIAQFLVRSGFCRIINLNGGIDAWSQLIDPSVHQY